MILRDYEELAWFCTGGVLCRYFTVCRRRNRWRRNTWRSCRAGTWTELHISISPDQLVCLGMVQMNLTVPHQQKGPALSCWAQRSISLPIATDPSLRGGVTRRDCSNCQGLFFTIEPCLMCIIWPLRMWHRFACLVWTGNSPAVSATNDTSATSATSATNYAHLVSSDRKSWNASLATSGK